MARSLRRTRRRLAGRQRVKPKDGWGGGVGACPEDFIKGLHRKERHPQPRRCNGRGGNVLFPRRAAFIPRRTPSARCLYQVANIIDLAPFLTRRRLAGRRRSPSGNPRGKAWGRVPFYFGTVSDESNLARKFLYRALLSYRLRSWRNWRNHSFSLNSRNQT